jgi:hypothetical protein
MELLSARFICQISPLLPPNTDTIYYLKLIIFQKKYFAILVKFAKEAKN